MIRECLINAGVDYDSGVRRFAGKPHLYEKYLAKFFEQNALTELQGYIEAGGYEAAFRSAHDIKGTAGTLCVNSVYAVICELTDYLRMGGTGKEAMRLCKQAMELYQEAEKAVKA